MSFSVKRDWFLKVSRDFYSYGYQEFLAQISTAVTVATSAVFGSPFATTAVAGAVGYKYVSQAMEKRELISELNEWCNEKRGTEEFVGRCEARKRIMNFYERVAQPCNLGSEEPDEPKLPDLVAESNSFAYLRSGESPAFEAGVLQNELNLSSCNLTSIPKGLNRLHRLKSLILTNNSLSNLVGVNFPPNLLKLELKRNQIRNLEGANFPSGLLELHLGYNQIETLEGANLSPQLKVLTLSDNQLTSFVGVNFPSSLRILEARRNQLRNLSGVIFPDDLQKLRLLGNPIRTFAGAEFPRGLQFLELSENPNRAINGLSLLARLPRSLVIDLEKTLSLDVFSLAGQRIPEIREQNPFIGPVVFYSFCDFTESEQMSLEQALENWKNEHDSFSSSDFSQLPDLFKDQNEKDSLSVFLQRIKQTADYKNSNDRVVAEVHQMLLFAMRSEVFREKMIRVIEDALSSCNDRVEFCRKQIETLRRIYVQDPPLTAREVCDLLIGTERSDLLDRHARAQLKKFHFRDDIETLLAYQIGLKERLNLPHTTETMLYGALSGVTSEMLRTAGDDVLLQSSSLEQKLNILLKYESWTDWLKQHARADFDMLNEAFADRLENAENKAQIDEIQKAQAAAEKDLIKKLTLQILQSQEPASAISSSKEEAKE